MNSLQYYVHLPAVERTRLWEESGCAYYKLYERIYYSMYRSMRCWAKSEAAAAHQDNVPNCQKERSGVCSQRTKEGEAREKPSVDGVKNSLTGRVLIHVRT